jgi:dihydrofolate reductase
MRKVIASLFISLDGVTESPEKWTMEYFDESIGAAMQSQMAAQDTALLGRRTYEEWAGYWPKSKDEPFASIINHMPKVVFSNTLDKVEWQNSRLAQGDLRDEITRLKAQPGQNLGTGGSVSLVRSLLAQDLLDELNLLVYPVVVGSGQRLFESGMPPKKLKLVNCSTTNLGVAILTYQPANQG